jgi:hypothetical protein
MTSWYTTLLWGPHTIRLLVQFITCDVMSERLTETVQFSQGFTPVVDLCKSLYFSSINCAVSPVNRTVSSVRIQSSSIRYRNEEKKRPFSLSLRDKQSSIHTAYCCYSFSVHCCPTTTFCYKKKTERTEKRSRGKTVKRPTRSVQISVQMFTQF